MVKEKTNGKKEAPFGNWVLKRKRSKMENLGSYKAKENGNNWNTYVTLHQQKTKQNHTKTSALIEENVL